jgi:hypothetical protein
MNIICQLHHAPGSAQKHLKSNFQERSFLVCNIFMSEVWASGWRPDNLQIDQSCVANGRIPISQFRAGENRSKRLFVNSGELYINFLDVHFPRENPSMRCKKSGPFNFYNCDDILCVSVVFTLSCIFSLEYGLYYVKMGKRR